MIKFKVLKRETCYQVMRTWGGENNRWAVWETLHSAGAAKASCDRLNSMLESARRRWQENEA